jgi:hypothetical protein
MDSPTRARVVSAEARASGRPRKIVDPAIAPSKAVAAKDIDPNLRKPLRDT